MRSLLVGRPNGLMMFCRITDLTSAYDDAIAAQGEQSAQIVTLMSQARDLRTARDEADADRAALATAKRALEQRLDEIGSEYLSANSGVFCHPEVDEVAEADPVYSGRLSNDRVMQTLQQERGELRRQLEERQDQISRALERQKKAEVFANE